MTELRVAAVQAAYVLMDRQATIDRVGELTAEAATKGAQLVVFPEGTEQSLAISSICTRSWSHQGEAGLEGGARQRQVHGRADRPDGSSAPTTGPARMHDGGALVWRTSGRRWLSSAQSTR